MKILFFAPEGALDTHFAGHCIVARSLHERGHEVLVARCHRCFDWCPTMEAHGAPSPPPPEYAERLCTSCRGGADRMLGAYGLPAVDLEPMIDDALRRRVADALATVGSELAVWSFGGVPFGSMALADAVLAGRVCDPLALTARDRLRYDRYLRNAIMAFFLAERLIAAHSPDRVVVFNNYALHIAVRAAAARAGIPSVCINHGGAVDRRRYIFLQRDSEIVLRHALEAWPAVRDLPLPPETVAAIGADLMRLLRGLYVRGFARAKTTGAAAIHEALGLDPNRRLLVAYTSSLDEFNASEFWSRALGTERQMPPQPFPNQIEWLKALAAHVSARPDLQLVVRVHPREGWSPDPDCDGSPHLRLMREAFTRMPERVRFVWPREPVASYDLAEHADVALVSWSSIGMDLARLGVPVLATTLGFGNFPSDDFLGWSSTPEGYFRELERLLDWRPDADSMARVYRAFHLFNYALDLGDVVPHYDYPRLPAYRTPREAAAIERAIVGGEEMLTFHRERMEVRRGAACEGEERAALGAHLRRALHYLMTGDAHPPEPLPPSLSRNGAPRSPMVARLERIVAEFASGAESRHGREPHRGTLILLEVEYDLLRTLYRGRPGLSTETFATQHETVLEALDSANGSLLARFDLSPGSGTTVMVVNAESLQRRWAEEARFGEYPWEEWLPEIAAAQVRAARPERLVVISAQLKGTRFAQGLLEWAGGIEEA